MEPKTEEIVVTVTEFEFLVLPVSSSIKELISDKLRAMGRKGPWTLLRTTNSTARMETMFRVQVEAKVAPPAGWPPNEPMASVLTPDGVRVVAEQRGSIEDVRAGRTQRGPERGGTSTVAMTAWMLEHHPGWRCSICGTCHPPDPCIPGAYF
jgi:hypothetical protein